MTQASEESAAAPPGPPADEPNLARAARRFDESLGEGERLLLAALFICLVALGFYRTIASVAYNLQPLWAVEGIRIAVFALAMIGAAYATHHKRNFSLDLLSKVFEARGRAVLRLVLNVATVLAAALLFYGGWLVKEVISKEKDYELVPKSVIGWFIPIAAALMIIHCLLHSVIEASYLAAGKAAPESEQAVH